MTWSSFLGELSF